MNRELVLHHWEVGRELLDRQRREGWGAKVIDRVSEEMRRAFPGVRGYSARNLKYMRRFAEAWEEPEFVQQVAAQIPWFHHCVLLDKTTDRAQREWYMRKSFEHGWSRNVLTIQIESGLYQRQGAAITNFDRTLPEATSDLANELVKDPYNFEFLGIASDAMEREIETGLLDKIRRFLLELGVGFAFVGNQYRLEVDGDEFFIDLLFYHLELRAFVVIELKAGGFVPEHVGKLNFYCSVVDDVLRKEGDGKTIGLLLCKDRNRRVAEYSLRDVSKPLGISRYVLEHALPSIAALEAQLDEGGEGE